jgi:hypothetical protein
MLTAKYELFPHFYKYFSVDSNQICVNLGNLWLRHGAKRRARFGNLWLDKITVNFNIFITFLHIFTRFFRKISYIFTFPYVSRCSCCFFATFLFLGVPLSYPNYLSLLIWATEKTGQKSFFFRILSLLLSVVLRLMSKINPRNPCNLWLKTSLYFLAVHLFSVYKYREVEPIQIKNKTIN